MPSDELSVHSLTEAALYLMLARCAQCGESVVPDSPNPEDRDPSPGDADRLDIPVLCVRCEWGDVLHFDVSGLAPAERAGGLNDWARLAEAGQAPPINRGDEPSKVIDAAGWLTLHSMLMAAARSRAEQAQSPGERTITRQLQIQAGQCLEEVLKFYNAENDLPPAEAFFTEEGREQFRRHPEMFLRERIASMRAQSTIGRG